MKVKKTVFLIIAVMFACSVFSAPALAASTKNETVYAMLNSDGSAEKIYVVNQLLGQYTDYGQYTDIKNLSTQSAPEISGDKVSFPDDEIDGGLYYQGTMHGELPFVFGFRYYIDGKEVKAEQLAGAAGRLKIEISGNVNDKCGENVREGYMAQIMLALDLKLAGNIVCEGATTVAAGNTLNINYMILPGKSGKYTLEADIHDFEISGINITLLKGTLAGFEDTINEAENGFDDMLTGANDMVDGTSELKDGVSTLANAIGNLSSGMSKASSGGDDYLKGMNNYRTGLAGYIGGINGVENGSAEIREGLDALAENSEDVANGISSISNGFDTLSSSSADLKSLAQSLSSSSDPSVQALALGTLQTLSSLDALSGGLNTASNGLDSFASGVQGAAAGYHTFDAGIKELSANGQQLLDGYDGLKDGFSSYLAGIKSISKGVKKMYTSVKKLPGNIQELIDGQIEFRDGIADAKSDITGETKSFVASDSPAVSFASPEKNHPLSVQYILKTPEIKIPKQEEQQQSEEKQEDFFTRLANLFK